MRVLQLYGVLSRGGDEIIEFFSSRAEAEKCVLHWDHDEPEQAGALEVIEVDLYWSDN